MRILISGHTGNVCRTVAELLVEEGHEICGVSRHGAGNPAFSSSLEADIGSRHGVESILDLGRCDAILHAAAVLDGGLFTSEVTIANCLGTQNMLRIASEWKTVAFIYLSSVPVIGLPRTLPITEDHPIAPESVYHASKLFGEHLCRIAGGQGIRTLVLRLTSPIGPGMPANRILSVFIRRALRGELLELKGRGRRRQDYVDVRDVAWVIQEALKKGASGLFNIAGGRSVSNFELAERVIGALGSSSRVAFSGVPDRDDDLNWSVSIEKASRSLDYHPRHELEDSVRWIAGCYESGSYQ